MVVHLHRGSMVGWVCGYEWLLLIEVWDVVVYRSKFT